MFTNLAIVWGPHFVWIGLILSNYMDIWIYGYYMDIWILYGYMLIQILVS